MSVLANARLLVGRTIVAVELNASDDVSDSGQKIKTVYDPTFILDNGARVFFVVQETEHGSSYGIEPRYQRKAKS